MKNLSPILKIKSVSTKKLKYYDMLKYKILGYEVINDQARIGLWKLSLSKKLPKINSKM